MKTVLSVDKMRESDAYTILNYISSIDLMQRAGEAIFNSCKWRGPAAIVCGSGNNGGDGYVIASLLKDNDIDCHIFRLSEKYSEQGKYFYDKCKSDGIPDTLLTSDIVKGSFSRYYTIVDAIFGTGFSGTPMGLTAEVIDEINRCRGLGNDGEVIVVSVDINSGLNGNTGMAEKCVTSDLTVSVGNLQPGHILNMAKDNIRKLVNCDIGIRIAPPTSEDACDDTDDGIFCRLEKSDFSEFFQPRLNFSHKGTYGYIGILGGCIEYSGAVKLANLSQSALRAGCGVAKLIIPRSIAEGVMPYILESTISVIPDKNGYMLFDKDALDRALSNISALAIGMGWGTFGENADILRYILKNSSMPIVIDADGLNTLASMPDADTLLSETECSVIMTPHLIEFQRLSGMTPEEVLSNPIAAAKQYASDHNVCLLLKGTATIITDGHSVYLTDRGCPGMATAGSGDILSGILAGLLGSHPPTAFTVACASYIAGFAGELAQASSNPVSMTASDTTSHVAAAVTELTL